MEMMLDDLQSRDRMPLVLPGWDDYSVWGWDGQEGSLYAQLWQNTDNSREQPRAWITPTAGWPQVRSLGLLAECLVRVTGCGDEEVRQAMAKCAPESVKAALLAVAA
jgi:hypothetical protein